MNNINRTSSSWFDVDKNTLKEKNQELEKKNIMLEQQVKLLERDIENLNKENIELKNSNENFMIGNQKKFILNEEKINIKKNSEINNKYIEELKLELNLAKSQAQNLNNILNGYKSQNNQLIIEFNQRKKEQTNEIDSLKFTVE